MSSTRTLLIPRQLLFRLQRLSGRNYRSQDKLGVSGLFSRAISLSSTAMSTDVSTKDKPLKVVIVSDYVRSKHLKEITGNIVRGRNVVFEDMETPCLSDFNETSLRSLDNHEVCFCDPRYVAPYVQSLKNIKWIASTFAGVDVITNQSLKPGLRVSRMGDLYGDLLTQYVIGQIFAFEREFYQSKQDQAGSLWNEDVRISRRQIKSLTIGILGVGAIGKELARTCKFFGMTVHGLVTKLPDEEAKSQHVDKYFVTNQLDELMKGVDYLCNILPKTDATDHLLSRNIFKNCAEKKAVFINVGRGNIYEEDDIINALDQGHLRHAILDVFDVEPLPTTSKLWSHPGITITPHNSGVADSQPLAESFCINLAKYIAGEPLFYEVAATSNY